MRCSNGNRRKINQEETDSSINEQLAKLINELLFKFKKPDETKIKEEGDKILRPENCESLVVTKVDELIWNRLRPSTRSFDSRVQTAQNALIKDNDMLDLEPTIQEKTQDAEVVNVASKLDKLIDKGMSATGVHKTRSERGIYIAVLLVHPYK